MKKIQIGLLGCGTVGTGVAKLLTESKSVIAARLGADLNLKRIADIDIETDRGVKLEPGVLTTDAGAVVNDPDIDIVIEGDGIAFAKTFAKLQKARIHTYAKFGTAVIIFEDGFKIDVASARLEY